MIKKTFILLTLISFFSCNQNYNDEFEGEIEFDKVQISSVEHTDQVKKIFSEIPSPMEITDILVNVNIPYNPEVLHSYKNFKNYTITEEIALNLGVYGTDLSYNRLYNQVQESINYYLAIRNLSNELGIYDKSAGESVEQLEENVQNKDSLLNVVSEIYTHTDAYLKSNNRGNVAALIILGGWVEAMYIATQVATNLEDNQKIITTIKDQKISLENLILFLQSYKDDQAIAKYLLKLHDLKKAFDKVEIVKDKVKVKTNEKTGMITINNKSVLKFSYKDSEDIKKIVSEIRSSMI